MIRTITPILLLVLGPVIAEADSTETTTARLWAPTAEAFEDGWTFTPSFSPGGDTAIVMHWADPLNLDEPQAFYRLKRTPGSWSKPQRISATGDRLIDRGGYTPDGEAFVFSVATARQIDGRRIDDFDLVIAATPLGSSAPEPIRGDRINLEKTPANATLGVAANELGARLTEDGSLWFWSQRPDATGWRDIFHAEPGPSGYREPKEFEWNTTGRESHPWLSPAGDEIIFSSNRAGTIGDDDLWYSRNSAVGTWMRPCRLPPPINTIHDEEAADFDPVTGQFLFTSDRPVDGRKAYRVWTVSRDTLVGSGADDCYDLEEDVS